MSKGSVKIETEILKKAYDFLIDLDKEEKETSFAMVRLLQDPPYDPGLVKLIDREARIYEVRGSTKDFGLDCFGFITEFRTKIDRKLLLQMVVLNSKIKPIQTT